MLSSLLATFFLIVAIQCVFYLLFTTPILVKTAPKQPLNQPISVVICAKNEAENLRRFLPSILAQTYSNTFEIVIINDRSTDATSEVLEQFSKENKCIKIVTVEDTEHFWGNKKYALTLGIKAASYEHLLFTDADCRPTHPNWIEEMSLNFSEQKNIVLGYGAYEKIKGSFLNKLIRYETLLTAIQYFSYAKIGIPYMGVGRNLAYTKSNFFAVNGFIKHIKIKSGDDDLFINEVATYKNTTICLDASSFTESVAKKTFNDWVKQKRRHITTSAYYKTKHKLLLGVFYISQLLFFILSIGLLLTSDEKKIVLFTIAIRYVIVYISIGLFSRKLKEKDLLPLLPIAEIVLIFFQLYLYLKNKSATPVKWH